MKIISMFSFIFFDTIRHLQLKHNILAKYNDLAKKQKKTELYRLTPTACLSDQSEKERFWRKCHTNPTQRSQYENSSEIRAGSDNIQRIPDFALWRCDTLTGSAPPSCFSCKIKGEGKIGGWVKGGVKQTDNTNESFVS